MSQKDFNKKIFLFKSFYLSYEIIIMRIVFLIYSVYNIRE